MSSQRSQGFSKFDAHSLIENALIQSMQVKETLLKENIDNISSIALCCTNAIAHGNKILFCGNGGSASDAQHLAAELLVRLRPTLNRQALPAIALAADVSTITACANDYGFEFLYERMVCALGQEGDVLIGISTSGQSPNVLRALKCARERGIHTIGFLGRNGGMALGLCDLALLVPSEITARVQEGHIVVGHIVMELVEEYLKDRGVLEIYSSK